MTSPPAYLVIYDVMAFASASIFALMILTAVYSKRVNRRKGWFSMMSCWLMFALSYGLLVGKQVGPEPASGHCFVQTVLIYATPPLVAVGTLSFYLDFYFGTCWDPSRLRPLQDSIANTILALPWIVHLAIDVEVVILILTSSSEPAVQRIDNGLYCRLNNPTTVRLVNAVIVTLAMVLLIPLEAWTGIQLYQSRGIRDSEDFRRFLSAFLRIAACTVVAVAAFSLGAITLTDPTVDSTAQNLSFPCLSMAVSLIFATQQDLLNAWFGLPLRYVLTNSGHDARSSMDQRLVQEEHRDLGISESSGHTQGSIP